MQTLTFCTHKLLNFVKVNFPKHRTFTLSLMSHVNIFGVSDPSLLAVLTCTTLSGKFITRFFRNSSVAVSDKMASGIIVLSYFSLRESPSLSSSSSPAVGEKQEVSDQLFAKKTHDPKALNSAACLIRGRIIQDLKTFFFSRPKRK